MLSALWCFIMDARYSDGTPKELFNGTHPVERWGLRHPTVASLAAALGVDAATPEEFCAAVVRKGAEQ